MPVTLDIWRGVLRDDTPWLKATLLRLGRGVRVRRRLAAALPMEIVADVLALWLSPLKLMWFSRRLVLVLRPLQVRWEIRMLNARPSVLPGYLLR